MTEDLRAVARKSENGAMILPYDVTTKNIVWADMQTAYLLMDSVASGRKPMQQIGSPTGFGKTTIAKQRFKNYGIVSEQEFYRSLPPLPAIPPANFPSMPAHLLKAMPQTRKTGMRRAVQGLPPFENAKKRLFIESGPKEPISLVRILFQCAMLGAARFLFDDPGKIAGDEASCDILKTALGMQRTVTYETPEISRNENFRISGHRSYNPFISPPDFPFPATWAGCGWPTSTIPTRQCWRNSAIISLRSSPVDSTRSGSGMTWRTTTTTCSCMCIGWRPNRTYCVRWVSSTTWCGVP
jgi:hypothetical protein